MNPISSLDGDKPRNSTNWRFTIEQRKYLYRLLSEAILKHDEKRREFIISGESSHPVPHDPNEVGRTIWMFLRSIDNSYQDYKDQIACVSLDRRRKHRSTGAPRGRSKKDGIRRLCSAVAHAWEDILGLKPTASGKSYFFEFIMIFIEEEGLGEESARKYVKGAIRDLDRNRDIWLSATERQAIVEGEEEGSDPTRTSFNPADLDAWVHGTRVAVSADAACPVAMGPPPEP
ncbi:MAG: hypothetical protein E6R14_09885 [Thermomicrobiales bacterium]|jgi:hypothetical protein|nr:MAG: hypothetical protein E6R14_09885 [Thermomicrobiales bacterium]